ncbi:MULTISPECIES: EamA family transporter [Providencia]|uniref:EamA family transporter n=1 Tax=Providencia TaxID=586 RepID=UPI003524D19F
MAAGAGVFIALNPLSAVIMGTLFLNEQLSTVTFIGGILIFWEYLVTCENI